MIKSMPVGRAQGGGKEREKEEWNEGNGNEMKETENEKKETENEKKRGKRRN